MTDKVITDYTMPDSKKIVCLGDSITAGYWDEEGLGWVSRLSQMIAKSYPLQYGVANAGISGDTTLDAYHNLLSQVMHVKPDILIIKIGVNDVNIREGIEPETLQRPHQFRMKSWVEMIDVVKKMQWQCLVVGALPIECDAIRFPAHDDSIEGMTSFRYEQKDILEYNNLLEEFITKQDIPFLRVFEDWLAKLDEGLFTDGLHPNAKGHALIAEQVYNKLNEIGYVS